jgi:hypothetical protein
MAKKAEYGRGHPNFLGYVDFIFRHPSYKGMPDAEMDDGSIQWEAPSNRTGGRFKDTHHKRREWWRAKAIEIGIDPNSAHWISKAAKFIHPTKKKPCKNCGKEMDIRYSYPSHILIKRIARLDYIDESFPLDPLEHRRTRVAFSSLVDYINKENRNAYIVLSDKIEASLNQVLITLQNSSQNVKKMDARLQSALVAHEDTSDATLRTIISELPNILANEKSLSVARERLEAALSNVAEIFSSMWQDERYICLLQCCSL